MGRLRQMARRPAVSLDDGFDTPAAGGVERSAELRDEMRTASKTLRGLPEPEREAFVMREWLGLDAGEAALALGMTAADVDGLASRARRSLVVAVGGLEPAIGCTGTRSALEAGSLDRAAKVHLLRCPVCRGVRRALRPPDSTPRPLVVERLQAAIPGFASGGGGILAALTAKAATAPVLAKTAAIVVAAVAAGGAAEQAIVNATPAFHKKSHGGKAQVAQARPPSKPAQRSGAALAVNVTPVQTSHGARLVEASSASEAARGAAALPTDRRGSSGSGSDHGGRSSSGSDNSGGSDHSSGSGSDTSGGHGGDSRGSGHDGGRSSTSGKQRAGGGDGASSGKGNGGDGSDSKSGSGNSDSGKSRATAGGGDSGDSGSGKARSGSTGSSGSTGTSDGVTSGSGSGSGDAGSPPVSGDGTPVTTDPVLSPDPAITTTTPTTTPPPAGGSD
jgi:hypothetical protein